MTFLHALATLWPKVKHRIPIYSKIFKPVTKGHKLVYARQAFLSLIFCFTLFSYAHAQSVGERADAGLTDIKPLKIGDSIPEELWHMPLKVVNHPDGKRSIVLSDFDKLIGLYVWSSWCGSCLKKFPNLRIFQNSFSETVDLLLFNLPSSKDSPERAAFSIEKAMRNENGSFHIASAVETKIWQEVLPSQSLGSILWFNNHGKMVGYTTPENINLDTLSFQIKTLMEEIK